MTGMFPTIYDFHLHILFLPLSPPTNMLMKEIFVQEFCFQHVCGSERQRELEIEWEVGDKSLLMVGGTVPTCQVSANMIHLAGRENCSGYPP